MNRAYSLLTIKAVNEDKRIITGIATTPSPDRIGDIVEPAGAEFKLPIPLLWQHNSDTPIGNVIDAKITPDGIMVTAQIEKSDEPGQLKDSLDYAWQCIKKGLVRGLSIGFKELEAARIEQTFSYRYLKWLWLELSAVTIPANGEATISTIKSIDTQQRVALGHKALPAVVRLNLPGASGSRKPPKHEECNTMKTIAEQIAALEAKRKANTDRMEAVMQKGMEDDRSSEEPEQQEFDTLETEVQTIDKDLKRLRTLERIKATSATRLVNVDDQESGSQARGGQENGNSNGASNGFGHISVKAEPKLPPGIGFARYAKCLALSNKHHVNPANVAEQLYGPNSSLVGHFKTAILGGTSISGNWSSGLVGTDTAIFADFADYLRPTTILGRFGTGSIPSLRQVPFRVPLVSQTAGGTGYWVGEGKAKPLTSFDFSRTTLAPLKVANIAVVSEETIRDSSPKADVIIRDELAKALRARLDTDFVDPSKSAVSGVSPASITNGAHAIASTGNDGDDVRLDVRSLMQLFITANNTPSKGVFIMSMGTALSLSVLLNPLGQREFPDININGGSFFGLPVITSEYAGTYVILLNADDIYEADDGEVAVDMSSEASLEMSDAPANEIKTPAASQMVSMFQTNSVAFRAERTINWARRRTQSVAYLSAVHWGGAVVTA